MTTSAAIAPGAYVIEAKRLEACDASIAALTACARSLSQEYVTCDQYEQWRAARLASGLGEAFLPSLPTIMRCFGSFTAAVQAAGLKTFAEIRTADLLRYGDAGTGLDEDRELAVAYAFSIYIGDTYTGERSYANRLCRIVGAIFGVEGPRPGGGWPFGKSVMTWLGMTVRDLDEMWRQAKRGGRVLPAEVLRAFFPPAIWSPMHELIEAGPIEMSDRVEELLRAWAVGQEMDGTPRSWSEQHKPTLGDGRLSESSIQHLATAAYGFMATLNECRILEERGKLALPRDASFFSAWDKGGFPARRSARELGALPAQTNRDAPSLRVVRLVLLILCAEIDALKVSSAGRRRLFQLLRDRAMIATFTNVGLRRGALARLDVADVREAFSFPHGETGPAITARPGKTVSPDLERPKGIPRYLFDWIKEYAEYAGIWDEKDAPLWLPNNKAARQRRERLSEESINTIIAARFTPGEAIAMGSSEVAALRRCFAEEYDGRVYGPHQLRHLAEQIGWMVGLDWLNENRSHILHQAAGLPASPQIFPDALLDHSMDSLGDRYKDVSSERGRLRWARTCALGIGEYLIGEKGARRGPDIALIREKERQLTEAEQQKARVEANMCVVKEQAAKVTKDGSTDERLGLILQLLDLAQQLGTTSRALEHARTALADAKKVEVPLPDSLNAAEVETLTTTPSSEDDVDTKEEPPLGIVRDWASLDEFHWALGGTPTVSMETIRRWARGETTRLAAALGLPEGLAGVNDGRPACVIRISARKQRVLLDQLNWSRFPLAVQERFEAIRRTAST